MISDNDLVFVGKDGQEIARLSTIGNYTKIGPIVHFGLNDTVDKTIEHKITRLKEPENMVTNSYLDFLLEKMQEGKTIDHYDVKELISYIRYLERRLNREEELRK